MGIFSSFFSKPTDKVSVDIRLNTDLVGSYMKNTHSKIIKFGDFTFEYLYTNSEPITLNGEYGSAIYIRIESPVHEYVSTLPADFPAIQKSIDQHQKKFSTLPNNLSKEKTRWLYFNMGKVFRIA